MKTLEIDDFDTCGMKELVERDELTGRDLQDLSKLYLKKGGVREDKIDLIMNAVLYLTGRERTGTCKYCFDKSDVHICGHPFCLGKHPILNADCR